MNSTYGNIGNSFAVSSSERSVPFVECTEDHCEIPAENPATDSDFDEKVPASTNEKSVPLNSAKFDTVGKIKKRSRANATKIAPTKYVRKKKKTEEEGCGNKKESKCKKTPSNKIKINEETKKIELEPEPQVE